MCEIENEKVIEETLTEPISVDLNRMTDQELKEICQELKKGAAVLVAKSYFKHLEAENEKLREAVKELICRLEWVVTSNDESRLVNGSIEQGRQALGI